MYNELIWLFIICGILTGIDGICGFYYRKITGENIGCIIPFYETFRFIKLLIKIKKESKSNANDN
jgi:hypothetical protein